MTGNDPELNDLWMVRDGTGKPFAVEVIQFLADNMYLVRHPRNHTWQQEIPRSELLFQIVNDKEL